VEYKGNKQYQGNTTINKNNFRQLFLPINAIVRNFLVSPRIDEEEF
jgi:hypothetical protein